MNAKRIIVIDDNPSIHDDFKKVLMPEDTTPEELLDLSTSIFGGTKSNHKKTTYTIDFADRGQDGAQKIQEALKNNNAFELAFVDMRMPNGWNGLETIKKIWEYQPDLQVVLCTAYSDFSWDEIKEELGHSDRFFVLKKPFDNIEVQQLAEALISRHAAEVALSESEQVLKAAQHVANIGHYTFSIKNLISKRSKTLEYIFGIRSDFNHSLETWFDLIEPSYREALLKAIDQSKQSEKSFELVCRITRWSDQERRWILASGYWEFNNDNFPIRFIGTMQDITEREVLQEKLRMFEACISQVNDAVIVTDSGDGRGEGERVVFVNDAFVRKTGYSREDIVGKNPRIMQGIKTQRNELKKIRRSMNAHQPIRVDIINYDKQGKEIWIDLSLTPVMGNNSQYSHWVGIQRELSPESVLRAIETVHHGETWVNRKATSQILHQIEQASTPIDLTPEQKKLSSLSKKESQILDSIMTNTDLSRKEIADSMHISEHTLRNHLASIYEKLDVRNRLELYIFCKQNLNK
jgi:PAS domain S-box-containing protein